jgi:hypothetical protein
MRLGPHDTVTGGTSQGGWTGHRCAIVPAGMPGGDQRDAGRVSVASAVL